MLVPQHLSVPVTAKTHSGIITTDRPNRMWGIDATGTVTLEDGQVSIFAAVDHCTAEGVGIHAVKRATRFEPLAPAKVSVNTSAASGAAPPKDSDSGTIRVRSL